jgi:hypothetical protein
LEGKTENHAVLTFDEQRRRFAAWLSAPSRMGTLSFVSPDAAFAMSFVLKSPESMMNDAFRIVGGKGQSLDRNLGAFQTGIHVECGSS